MNAEHHLDLAKQGEMEADDAIVRYARALEAQLKEALDGLATLVGGDERPSSRWRKVEDIFDWLHGNRHWIEPALRKQKMDHWQHFLYQEISEIWQKQLAPVRNRAAHGNRYDRALRVEREALKVRRCLLESKEEGGQGVFQDLAAFVGQLAEAQGAKM